MGLKSLLGAYFGVPTSLGGVIGKYGGDLVKGMGEDSTDKADKKLDQAEEDKQNRIMSAIPANSAPQIANLFDQKLPQQGQFPITSSLMQDPMWNDILKKLTEQQQQKGGG